MEFDGYDNPPDEMPGLDCYVAIVARGPSTADLETLVGFHTEAQRDAYHKGVKDGLAIGAQGSVHVYDIPEEIDKLPEGDGKYIEDVRSKVESAIEENQ